MKITAQQLKKIIAEEINNVVTEMPGRPGGDFYSLAPQVEAKLDQLRSMSPDLGQARTRMEIKVLCQDIINLLKQMG